MPKTIRKGGHALRRLFKDCRNWVGPKVAIYKSSTDGVPAICRKLQQNWWHCRRTFIFTSTTQAVAALQQATRSIPIVFAQVSDPVSGGFVASLAKPGGNVTGFTNYDYGMGAKWVELLKEIAPYVTHVGVIRDPTTTVSIGQFAAIQSAARTFGLEVSPLGGRDAKDIEQTVTEFAGGSNRGLIATGGPLSINNRDLIISLAARHRLPTVYPVRFFVTDGTPPKVGGRGNEADRCRPP